jgi:hypothetical protein
VHPRPECRLEQLLDVIRVDAPSDAETRLELVQLYADGFALTWTEPPGDHRAGAVFPLAGDRRHRMHYFSNSGGGHTGGNQRPYCRQIFAPQISDRAHEFRITIGEEGFIVSFPGR